MKKDALYADKKESISPFTFNEEVVEVFDDMIRRSVPCYEECQNYLVDLCQSFCKPEGSILDLGCATGETLFRLGSALSATIQMTGVDSSPSMITAAQNRCRNFPNIQLEIGDIRNLSWSKHQIILSTYVLQFISPEERLPVLVQAHQALPVDGALVLFEKIKAAYYSKEFIHIHESFKRRNGYSEMEIKQKREALESTLIPLTLSENVDLLKKAGFEKVETFFQVGNFAGILATKK